MTRERLLSARRTLAAASDEGGFTLIEMLIVVAIIGLIGTLVATNVMSRFDKAKFETTKVQVRNLGTVLNQYRLDCGRYPSTDEGLDGLIANAGNCKNFDPEGYIEGGKVPQDGFGNGFDYISDGRTYEIRSLGRDGAEGGEGWDKDISSNEKE